MKINTVYLADDHKIMRDLLIHFLKEEPTVKIVGEADNGLKAYKEIVRLKPEIAVLDISMKQINGIDLCRKLKVDLPDLKVIILTMHKSEEMLHNALSAGVAGYVLKENALDDLLKAIKLVGQGRIFISSDMMDMIVTGYLNQSQEPSSNNEDLITSREREILQMLAEGRTNKEIAENLQISIKTVETHRANLMKKLKLKNIADLVLYAVRNHLIDVV